MRNLELEFQAEVETWLMDLGVECRDGIPAAISQTGEPYTELTITANSRAEMLLAVVGAVSFNRPRLGHGLTCYWRVRPELRRVDDKARCFVMFLLTNKQKVSRSSSSEEFQWPE